MIIQLPEVPDLIQGKAPRPLVVLLGAERGEWQARAAKLLEKQDRKSVV